MSKTEQFKQISQCENHLALGLQKDEQTDDSKVIIASHFETEDDLALMLIKLIFKNQSNLSLAEIFFQLTILIDFIIDKQI